MAEITAKYKDLEERKSKVNFYEKQNYRMIHDDFDSDWKTGDEPHGILTFTDELGQSIEIEPTRDLFAEIDDLRTRLEKLEKK